MSLWPPSLNQRCGFCSGVIACQLTNGLCWNVGNFFCPFRRFVYPIFCAKKVGNQRFVGWYAFWHRVFIKTESICVDKCLIVEIFADNDVHHRVHQRIVRGRQQRDPLFGKRRYSVGITRIYHDKTRTVLLHFLKKVIGVTEDGFRWVMPPEDHQFGIQKSIHRVTAGRHAIRVRRCRRSITQTN